LKDFLPISAVSGHLQQRYDVMVYQVMEAVRVMVLNAIFNNIPVISWQSVLLVEETGVHGENHRPAVSDKFYHIILYRVHLPWVGFELITLVVIGTDCIGSYKSNYHDGPYGSLTDFFSTYVVSGHLWHRYVVMVYQVRWKF
jgi:ABC-type sulfate transport system permease subunit